ncbi:MAG: ABC transporter permease, partial [Candidatus Latescibacteria bacterium]|nr:ABC transporter permease [Candidatus Latescibacterota bacterium]
MKALNHLVKKEFIQIFRSKPMIAVTFGFPIIQLIVLGFAISGDVVNIPTALTDLDNSSTSRSLVSRLENTRYLEVIHRPAEMRGGDRLLQHGDVILSVTIPRGFEREIVRNEKPALSINADAQNSQVAVTGSGYVRRIVRSWAQSWARSSGYSVGTASLRGIGSVELESRIWYNEELKSVYFMVPGIITVLVTVITIILTSMSIVREREIGTLEQLLVTPITRLELILGKT